MSILWVLMLQRVVSPSQTTFNLRRCASSSFASPWEGVWLGTRKQDSLASFRWFFLAESVFKFRRIIVPAGREHFWTWLFRRVRNLFCFVLFVILFGLRIFSLAFCLSCSFFSESFLFRNRIFKPLRRRFSFSNHKTSLSFLFYRKIFST